jgi:hypothetical protein
MLPDLCVGGGIFGGGLVAWCDDVGGRGGRLAAIHSDMYNESRVTLHRFSLLTPVVVWCLCACL